MASPNNGEILDKLRASFPDLPKPLVSLQAQSASTWGSYLNISNHLPNLAVKVTGASKWQTPSLVYRRLDDLALQSLQYMHPDIRVTRPKDILSAFEKTVSRLNAADKSFVRDLATRQCSSLEAMSASSFFWQLYVDPHLNEDLSEAGMLTIGNAFLFAQWKEYLEGHALMPLLSHATTPPDLLRLLDTLLNSTFSGSGHAERMFGMFVKGELPAQLMLFTAALTDAHLLDLLHTTPWCGLFAVLETFRLLVGTSDPHGNHVRSLRIQSIALRAHVEYLWIDSRKTDGSSRYTHRLTYADRNVNEYRFRLSLLVNYVVPKLPRTSDIARLVATAKLLITQDVVVDFNGTASEGLEAFAKEVLKQTPTLKSVLAAQEPVLSQFAADFLEDTWNNISSRVYHSEGLRMLMLVGLSSGTGLFLSKQRQLIVALAHVLRLLIRELLL